MALIEQRLHHIGVNHREETFANRHEKPQSLIGIHDGCSN